MTLVRQKLWSKVWSSPEGSTIVNVNQSTNQVEVECLGGDYEYGSYCFELEEFRDMIKAVHDKLAGGTA